MNFQDSSVPGQKMASAFFYGAVSARYDLPRLMQQAEEASKNQMRGLIAETDWDGIKVESSLQIGHAGQQICARTVEHSADLRFQ